MTFNELGLNARMVSRLEALGLTQPTPNRDIAQACLASLDVGASPDRPEAEADEG